MRKAIVFTIALLGLLKAGAAGAYFTGQAQVPENLVKAGTIAISTEPTQAALSIDAIAPGVAVTKPLTVVNDGNLPVSVVVSAAKKSGITAFYDALSVKVSQDGAPLYDGPMTEMKTAPVTVPPGSRVPLQFAVSIPATAGNELSGGYAKFTLYIDGEQVH
jgi:hypothetical protein